MRLKSANKSLLEGEPVFVLLSVENEGTNTASVGFGKFMIGNIFLSTSADSSVKQSKQLLEGGLHVGHNEIILPPNESYKTILLVNDWLTLRTGKTVLNIRIKWDKGELSALLPVVISKSSDEELEEALKQIVLGMSGHRNLSGPDYETYRRGLKNVCHNPQSKAALVRIRKILTEAISVEILSEILLNYDKGISD
jgi:hypothetical protein